MASNALSRRSFLAVAGATLASVAFAGSSVALAADEKKEEKDTTAQIDAEAYDKLIASGPVADDDVIAASAWASAVKKAGKLRVGGTRTSTLFSLENIEDGAIRGFDAGLYQLLTRYILGDETKYELTQVTSDTRESVLQNDQVDVVFATYSITPSRAELISFAGPYYTSQQGILVKKDNEDIKGVEDLADRVVAAQSGSTGPQIVEEVAPDAIVEEFTTDEEARTALEQGRVDAYVIDITLQMGSVVKNPDKYKIVGEVFGPIDPYGIGLPLDSDGVAFVNDFLKLIEDEGIWADLWQVAIGDRTGLDEAPEPPAIDGEEEPAEGDEKADEKAEDAKDKK